MDSQRLAQFVGQTTASDIARAAALYNEAFTYLRLASDHAKFMRNGFDQTQESLFREADSLAQRLDVLRAELCSLQEPVAPAAVFAFVEKAAPLVQELINFKNRVADAVDACVTQQVLPSSFIRHLRREANFFQGIVQHVMGGAIPDRATLDLPGAPQERVATIARLLIDAVPEPEARAASLAYSQFWGKHHLEHADVLTQFLRPEQASFIAMAARFRDDWRTIVQQSREVETAPTLARFATLNRNVVTLGLDWRNFLLRLNRAQRECSVQSNFTQRLSEHIKIETDLLLEAVLRAASRGCGC